MEEIEYLEEYEDLVLPAINIAADAAATTKTSKPVNVDNDGSSSSLDQDIFNCLFDDNSDDDNDEQQQPLKDQKTFDQKIVSDHILGELNKVSTGRGEQQRDNTAEKHTAVIKEKDSTKAPGEKSLFSKSYATDIVLTTKSVKTKTVGTVKPAAQQKSQLQKSDISKQKNRNLNTTSTIASSKSASSELRPSTSALSRHHLVTSDTNKVNTSHRPKTNFNKQRPATIVKPEKIVTRDPAEDPLNLDDFSSAESANYSVSDISGETYNSISDFDDDDYDFTTNIDILEDDDDESSNSQVIDISNDSSETRSHFEDLRGATPSPVVSEDRDLHITSGSTKQRSLTKFMANHEIIKSLLTKGEKPKLLQLINEHDKADNSNQNLENLKLSSTVEAKKTDKITHKPAKSDQQVNRGQQLAALPLSSTTKVKKNDLPAKAPTKEPSVLSPHVNKDNTRDKSILPSESSLLNITDQEGKSNTVRLSQPTESKLHNVLLKDASENSEKSGPNLLKSSKRDSMPNQEDGVETEFGNQKYSQASVTQPSESMKDSKPKSSEEGKKCQSIKLETKYSDTEESRKKIQTPISKEANNDKDSTSVRARKNRFRNLTTPEIIDLKNDNSIEIASGTKCDAQSIQTDNTDISGNREGNNYVTKHSTVLHADSSKTKTKDEQKTATTKLMPKEHFKSPTKGADNVNKSRDRSSDRSNESSKETLNKHVMDLPRPVIINPFVQRTVKNTFNKDGRAKTSRESSRDNSRESSIESSKSCSKEGNKDNAKNSKNITTSKQLESKLKELGETNKKSDNATSPVSANTKKRESTKGSNDKTENKSENKLKASDKEKIYKNKSIETKDVKNVAKSTKPLADTKYKEIPKSSIDKVERKSDIKMIANVSAANKSLGHVTKDLTISVTTTKAISVKTHSDKQKKSNEGISGSSNLNENKPSIASFKQKVNPNVASDLAKEVDNTRRKVENVKDDKCKNQKQTPIKSGPEEVEASNDIVDFCRLSEKSKERKDVKQSTPSKCLEANKKSLTTDKEIFVDGPKEVSKSAALKAVNRSVEKPIDAINHASLAKDSGTNTSAKMSLNMPPVKTETNDPKLKGSKTPIRDKETSNTSGKVQHKSSQDVSVIKIKEMCPITSIDKALNSPNEVQEHRDDGSYNISKPSVVNTTKTLEPECSVKTKPSVAADINLEQKVSKPTEEKKHTKSVLTSIQPTTSTSDASKEKDSPVSDKSDVSKNEAQQVDPAEKSVELGKSSRNENTDDAGAKNIENSLNESAMEQTTGSKRNEKSDLKTEKCEHTEKYQNKNKEKESISKETNSSAYSDPAISIDENSIPVVNLNEPKCQKPPDQLSSIKVLGTKLNLKEIKDRSIKNSKEANIGEKLKESLKKAEDTTNSVKKNYKNDDQDDVSGSDKDTVVQQDVIEPTEIKTKRNQNEGSSNIISVEINLKDVPTMEEKQTISKEGRCEVEPATTNTTDAGAAIKKSQEETKQNISDKKTGEEIRNEEASAEDSYIQTPTKLTPIGARKTRSTKPDEILIRNDPNDPSKLSTIEEVGSKSPQVDNRKSKNAKSEISNMTNKGSSELSQMLQVESKEALVGNETSCEIDSMKIDNSDDQTSSVKSGMRKTRSIPEEDKLNISNILKSNEKTIKTSQRIHRKNKNTVSESELLEDNCKSEESFATNSKNVSLYEPKQFGSAQKKDRKTRCALDTNMDNAETTKNSDIQMTQTRLKCNLVAALALNDGAHESTQPTTNLAGKSDTATLGLDCANITETNKITVTCIENEKQKKSKEEPEPTESVLKSPGQTIEKTITNEPSPKCRQNLKDDINIKEYVSTASVLPAVAVEEIAKIVGSSTSAFLTKENSKKLVTEILKNSKIPTTSDVPDIIDQSKIGHTMVSTASTESLDNLTLCKGLINTETDLVKEATCFSAEPSRTLRKRGAESPLCENRDGTADKTVFKTPINVIESRKMETSPAPEVRIKRRLRSPAVEKEPQAPLSKKSKIDIRKARNRNIGILGTSESLLDVVVQQLPEASNQSPVLSPRRSLQKHSANTNEIFIDSAVHAHDSKSNMPKSCKLKPSHTEDVHEDRKSSGKTDQLSSNFVDENTSTIDFKSKKGKSDIAFSKGLLVLSDTNELKQLQGTSKTYPEWLKGNSRNDTPHIEDQSIANTTKTQTAESIDSGKPIGVQEILQKNPIETMPEQKTELRSHLSRQVSPKRSRKAKSVYISKETETSMAPAETVENISEITKDTGKNSQSHINTQEIGVNEAVKTVPEQVTKSNSKKQFQTPQKQDISPKRGRKFKTVPAGQTEKGSETTSHDVATGKSVSLSSTSARQNDKNITCNISMESEQSITSVHENNNESIDTTQKPNSSLAEVVTGEKKVESFIGYGNISPTISSPPKKSGRRRPKIRSRRVHVTRTINKDQQKIKNSLSSKQDKKLNKKSEIDILIESMSKEMKDAGINDLLNASSNVKRQRAVARKSNYVDYTFLSPTPVVASETAATEKKINEGTSIIEPTVLSNAADENNKTSPTRRSLPKRLVSPKEINKCPTNTNLPRSMEMEKALIDEVEIINMNTSFLEPPKYVSEKQHRPSSKLALEATSGFKTPKPLSTINRIKPTDDVPQLYLGKVNTDIINFANRVSSLKCRKLKVKINRREVKKQLQNFKLVQTSKTNLFNRTENNTKGPNRATIISAISSLPKSMESDINTLTTRRNPTVPEVKKNTGIAEGPLQPTIDKESGEVLRKQHTLIIPRTIPTSALYTEQSNMTRGNCRNMEETTADAGIEPMVPIELKNEFLDENPNSLCETALPDTPTLIARSHTITQAAATALSNTIMPTDIRLLTNDPTSTRAYVPSFGVTPTLVDARGARMYTFLHPAKYSRNHGNVLLDYCCPNLDGPMPAIDPTRIHAQVQTPVIELPSCIILTTKVVTRAELESKSSTIPAVIRKKAEKLRSNIHQDTGTPKEAALNTVPSEQSLAPLHLHSPQISNSPQAQHPAQALKSVMPVLTPQFSQAPRFSPAINALAKYLPSTTTITAKVRPPLSQQPQPFSVPSTNQQAPCAVSVLPKTSPLLSEAQINVLRSHLRRLQIIIKSLAEPFEKLNFTEHCRIIDNLVMSGKFLPMDLERTIILMEEYLKQINLFQKHQITDASSSGNFVSTSPLQSTTNLIPTQMPPLQPAPKLASARVKSGAAQNSEQVHSTAMRKVQSTVKQHNSTVNTTTIQQRQVPIYDTERNIIGYQLQVIAPVTTMPGNQKATLSSTSGGTMSSTLGVSSNNQRKPLKRPAQDSPRVFFTSQPMQGSIPTANLNSMQYSTTPMSLNQNAQTIGKSKNGSIVTTIRSAVPTSTGTETITTTTMATVKRVTRSRAAGSKIVFVSKSNSKEETILPDVSHQSEIKHEKDVEDFIG